jgi:small subunit ribosomal protein S2
VPLVTAQELIDAGVHYGHQASRWNPKMKPYIHGKRHKIHVLNLEETIKGLYQASHFLRRLCSAGAQVLFLGTKRQIRAVVEQEAKKCGMPAITERWIGGTLTNFAIVRERLQRLLELEQMEADGSLDKHKKKAQATMRREIRRIRRNLEGVRDLYGLPGAIVVVDPRREEIAVKEAAKMNVPVICILDTDCDPDLADIVIPANDDAMSSVQLVMQKLSEAVVEGRKDIDEGTLKEAQRQAADDPRNRQVQGRRQDAPQGPRGGDRGRGDRGERGPGGPRRGGGGGRPGPAAGRQATGRFADRLGGHADSISIGTEPPPAPEGAATPKAATPACPAAEAPRSRDH